MNSIKNQVKRSHSFAFEISLISKKQEKTANQLKLSIKKSGSEKVHVF